MQENAKLYSARIQKHGCRKEAVMGLEQVACSAGLPLIEKAREFGHNKWEDNDPLLLQEKCKAVNKK